MKLPSSWCALWTPIRIIIWSTATHFINLPPPNKSGTRCICLFLGLLFFIETPCTFIHRPIVVFHYSIAMSLTVDCCYYDDQHNNLIYYHLWIHQEKDLVSKYLWQSHDKVWYQFLYYVLTLNHRLQYKNSFYKVNFNHMCQCHLQEMQNLTYVASAITLFVPLFLLCVLKSNLNIGWLSFMFAIYDLKCFVMFDYSSCHFSYYRSL